MHRLVVLLTCLAIIGVDCPRGESKDEDSVGKFLEKAHKYEDTGNLKEAIHTYEIALERTPENREIRKGLIDAWTKVIDSDPKNPKNYIERGKVFQRFNNLFIAAGEFKRAIENSPGQQNQQAFTLLEEVAKAQQLAEDSRHFEAEKQKREAMKAAERDSKAFLYAERIKVGLEKAWTPVAHSGLLITKRTLKLDSAGKIIDKKLVVDSALKGQNSSVDALLTSFQFAALPKELEKIELNLSFMSDGTTNIVEVKTPQMQKATGYGGPAIAVASSTPRGSGSVEVGRESAQADVDCGPYMADLQRRIKRAWFPPKGEEMKRVVVVFDVKAAGEVAQVRLDHSSGSAAADEAALNAVKKCTFRPLPAGAPPSVSIQFTFDYNVFSGGGRGVFRQF